jgi:hypothetical protein
MEAINITAYPSDVSQVEAIKAVLKALKIQFKVTKEASTDDNVRYNSEFVAKIKKSQQAYKDGHFVTVEKENFKEFLGIE